MILSVHQPQYIPWLGYFDKILKSDCFVVLDQVQYKAREYQNRNRIRTNHGWMWLTVPVKSSGQGRQKISRIKIDNSTGWRKKHSDSLRTWYKKAESFHDHFPFFEDVFTRDWDDLQDLNIHIMRYMLEKLGIHRTVYFESDLDITATKTERIIDICRKLNADVYLSGSGGRDYLEENKFTRAGIKLEYQNFSHPRYRQQHMAGGDGFMPYMSCIDLLFNEGRKSSDILRGERGNQVWYIR
ncbi:MAG: WbqC family protein [Nitrospiraceae bacterium]|nr:MAG: WbqC family protein [Nitrospiraceae bacterium]